METNGFLQRSDIMETEIIVAIIGAIGAVVASVITVIVRKKGKEISKTAPLSNSMNVIEGSQNVVGDNNNVQFVLNQKEEALLQIVDTEFVTEDDGFFIDIKLRNSGDRIAYLKEIEFNIHDIYAMINPQFTNYQLITPTATYDIILNGKKKQKFSLSQAIAANGVDRFRIKVASSIAETKMVTVYYFSFVLHYNEDDKTTESQKYIAVFPSTSEWAACYVSHTSMEIAKANYLELLRISKYDCIKSDAFLGILKSYEESKNDFM